MDWSLLIYFVDGETAALAHLTSNEWRTEADLGSALLLLDDAPHPAASLVGAGFAARLGSGRPVAAALARHAAPALAEWRADPDWAKRCIGVWNPDLLIRGAMHLIGALHHDPAALRDATIVVTRDGPADAIASCLANLGAAGWELLNDAERRALWTRAWQNRPAALGCVWPALTAAQQAETTQQSERKPILAADLIGRIGAAAWAATDAALRRRLIDAAVREPSSIHLSAPAWDGMSDAERARLVTAVADDGAPGDAYSLLHALGHDGRMMAPADRRAALDRQAARADAWRTALLRLADAGWDSLSDAERRTLMARTKTVPPGAAALIRAVGIDGWRATPTGVRATLRASVQRDATMLLSCPPALWRDLADGRPLPPAATATDSWVIETWRAEDAADDLSALPPEHQAAVLAIAPWRASDCAPSSPRMARLLAAWNGMTADARADLATAHPWTLAVVAAAARLAAREPGIAATSHQATATIVDALTGMVLRTDPAAAARATVGRMLAAQRCWRTWMLAFVPTDNDPPEAWNPWLAAARRSAIRDRGIVLRLMAHDAQRAPRRRRRGRGGG